MSTECVFLQYLSFHIYYTVMSSFHSAKWGINKMNTYVEYFISTSIMIMNNEYYQNLWQMKFVSASDGVFNHWAKNYSIEQWSQIGSNCHQKSAEKNSSSHGLGLLCAWSQRQFDHSNRWEQMMMMRNHKYTFFVSSLWFLLILSQ